MQKQTVVFITIFAILSIFIPVLFKNSPVLAQLVTPPITPPETPTASPTLKPTTTPTSTPSSAPSVSPTPFKTSTPTPSAMETATATAQPSPTATPTSTSKPARNRRPVITTEYLPIAHRNKEYEFTIRGYDRNENDFLTLEVEGLPDGIEETDCDYNVVDGRKEAECTYSGEIDDYGIFRIKAVLKDDHGKKDQVTLFIYSTRWFRFYSRHR